MLISSPALITLNLPLFLHQYLLYHIFPNIHLDFLFFFGQYLNILFLLCDHLIVCEPHKMISLSKFLTCILHHFYVMFHSIGHNCDCQTFWTYLYLLVGAVDHSDKHVQQNHHHSYVIYPIQDIPNVLYKLMVVLQDHGGDFRQTKYGPEQSFKTLLHSAETKINKKTDMLLIII